MRRRCNRQTLCRWLTPMQRAPPPPAPPQLQEQQQQHEKKRPLFVCRREGVWTRVCVCVWKLWCGWSEVLISCPNWLKF